MDKQHVVRVFGRNDINTGELDGVLLHPIDMAERERFIENGGDILDFRPKYEVNSIGLKFGHMYNEILKGSVDWSSDEVLTFHVNKESDIDNTLVIPDAYHDRFQDDLEGKLYKRVVVSYDDIKSLTFISTTEELKYNIVTDSHSSILNPENLPENIDFNGTLEFDISADPNYEIKDVIVNGESIGNGTHIRVTNITFDVRIIVISQGIVLTPLIDIDENCILTILSETRYGQDMAFKVIPNVHYEMLSVNINGETVQISENGEYTVPEITSPVSVIARTQGVIIPVNVHCDSHMTCAIPTVRYDETLDFTVDVDNGYEIKSIIYNGNLIGTNPHIVVYNVRENVDITVVTQGVVMTINIDTDDHCSHSIIPTVRYGDDLTFEISTDTHYEIENVNINGESIGDESIVRLYNITQTQNIIISSQGEIIPISVNTDDHCDAIIPTNVRYGDNITIPVTFDQNYELGDITDGRNINSNGDIVINNVTTNPYINIESRGILMNVNITVDDHVNVIQPPEVRYGDTNIKFRVVIDDHYELDTITSGFDVIDDYITIDEVTDDVIFSITTIGEIINLSIITDDHCSATIPSNIRYDDSLAVPITFDTHYEFDYKVGDCTISNDEIIINNIHADSEIKIFSVGEAITVTVNTDPNCSVIIPNDVRYNESVSIDVNFDEHYELDTITSGYTIENGSIIIDNITSNPNITITSRGEELNVTVNTDTHCNASIPTIIRYGDDITIPVTFDQNYELESITSGYSIINDAISIVGIISDTTIDITSRGILLSLNVTTDAHVSTVQPSVVRYNDDISIYVEFDNNYELDTITSGYTIEDDYIIILDITNDVNIDITSHGVNIPIHVSTDDHCSASFPATVRYGDDLDIPVTFDDHYELDTITSGYTISGGIIHLTNILETVTIDITSQGELLSVIVNTDTHVSSVVPNNIRYGDDVIIPITFDEHYILDTITSGYTIDGGNIVLLDVSTDHNINITSIGEPYTVTVNTDDHVSASINIANPRYGDNVVISLTYDENYVLNEITNGYVVEASDKIYINNISRNHTINISSIITYLITMTSNTINKLELHVVYAYNFKFFQWVDARNIRVSEGTIIRVGWSIQRSKKLKKFRFNGVLTTDDRDTYQFTVIGDSTVRPVTEDSGITDTSLFIPPLIFLYGDYTPKVEVGSVWNDPGWWCVDGNGTIQKDMHDDVIITGDVDTNNAGEYLLQYDATDDDGKPAITRTRIVTVGYNCAYIPLWDSNTVYDSAGIRVKYDGGVFESKYWTQGDVPDKNDTNGPWDYLGDCL